MYHYVASRRYCSYLEWVLMGNVSPVMLKDTTLFMVQETLNFVFFLFFPPSLNWYQGRLAALSLVKENDHVVIVWTALKCHTHTQKNFLSEQGWDPQNWHGNWRAPLGTCTIYFFLTDHQRAQNWWIYHISNFFFFWYKNACWCWRSHHHP